MRRNAAVYMSNVDFVPVSRPHVTIRGVLSVTLSQLCTAFAFSRFTYGAHMMHVHERMSCEFTAVQLLDTSSYMGQNCNYRSRICRMMSTTTLLGVCISIQQRVVVRCVLVPEKGRLT